MEHQVIAGPPGQHIVIGLPETDADADAIRAAQLPRSTEPDARALAEVAADLDRIDRSSDQALDELLAQLPDPAQPERPEALPPLTPEQQAAHERAFVEAYPEVAQAWREEHGAAMASVMVRDARAGAEALGVPALEAIDAIAGEVGLTDREEVAVWSALARAGARQAFGTGGRIGELRIDAFEAADTKTMLQEAMSDGVMPADTMSLWANGRLGNAVSTIMNARRAVAHLGRQVPELLQLAVEQGLHRDPQVWRRLAALGAQLPRKGTTTMQTTTTKPAGEAAPDEATVRAQLEHMMQDPRYFGGPRQPRDPAFVRKVEDGFKKLYGRKS